MYEMTESEFEKAVDEAIATIPERFLGALENIAITIQDEPTDEQLASIEWVDEFDDEEDWADDEDGEWVDEPMLGLYEGVPLTERGDSYGSFGDVPDVITVFKGPHERCFDSREEIVEEIRKTVVHEIGHYFGIDDERLYEMGY